MNASTLFVVLARAGGLLLGTLAVVSAASSWSDAFGAGAVPGLRGWVIGSIALALIGFGLTVAAPAVGRLLRWPDGSDDEGFGPGLSRADVWRLSARGVALIAVVKALGPLASVVTAICHGDYLLTRPELRPL